MPTMIQDNYPHFGILFSSFKMQLNSYTNRLTPRSNIMHLLRGNLLTDKPEDEIDQRVHSIIMLR